VTRSRRILNIKLRKKSIYKLIKRFFSNSYILFYLKKLAIISLDNVLRICIFNCDTMILNGVTSNKVRMFLFTYPSNLEIRNKKSVGTFKKIILYRKSFKLDSRKFAQFFFFFFWHAIQTYKVKRKFLIFSARSFLYVKITKLT